MPEEKRPLTADDLYNLQLVTDPQISPDGCHIIFGLIRVDRQTEKKYTNLWLATVDGRTPPHQFTYGNQTDTRARWSPDGRHIAFLSNRKNEKQMQIHIIPFHGGEARPVTEIKGNFAGFEWSPNGTRFVAQFRQKDAEALEREEDEQKKKLGIVSRHITSLSYKYNGEGYLPQEKWHIWTFDAGSGEGTQLTAGEFHETGPRWSPDGKQVLFVSNRHPQWELNQDETELYLIAAEGGEMQMVETGHHGRKYSPTFSPDGRQIAYMGRAQLGDWYQNSCLYVVAAAGGQAHNLSAQHDLHLSIVTLTDTGSDTPQPPPIWSNDGAKIYIQATERANQPLLTFDATTGELERLIDESGLVGSFSLSTDQSTIAYLWGTTERPGQVWQREMGANEGRPLTHFNDDLFAEIAWGELEEVWIKGPDGGDLQGWILRPPGFDPDQQYPSILEIHGGPMAQYGRAFMHEFHFLAASGYVVSFCNPRGSQGYGQTFAGAIANCWGTVDYDDVMAWANYVENLPAIDPERMGVTGGSYGGYITALIIGKTHRFKAAVGQRVVSNLLSFYGSSDMNWSTEHLINTETQPWNDLAGYWRQSPMATIGNARTPTLIIHSESDFRCDREQGEQVFVALKQQGVEAEMVLFPEESHGLSRNGRTDRRVQRLEHMRRWFDNYLK
ncbi:MAG: S9 family peptidase [Chloroflexi bacterium]|nr:S9 family peptidase [Chloroflexota bacterium]